VRAAWLIALAACGGSGDDDCSIESGKLCKQLSSYGLFDDVSTQTPAAGVIPYQVNTPLFSDYAVKDRFLYLPAGTTMQWSDDAAFVLPTGAALIKTFSYPADRRDPSAGVRRVETRVLARTAEGWTGGAYVYNDDGRDAKLAVAGEFVDVDWIHDDGSARTDHYAVPNKNQCKNCHAEHDDTVDAIGVKARHLNRGDQLQQLVDSGALVGAPPAEQWPRAPIASDPTTGTLDQRARAWLDINCGYCHNANGGLARTSGLYLDLTQTEPIAYGVCKPPVAAGNGSGGRQFAIVPGQPDASILMFRIESTEPAIKMPELGRNLVDAEDVAMIREWIAAMPGNCDL
jgi:uncharacterized repeat protein (TIGR03806 family)